MHSSKNFRLSAHILLFLLTAIGVFSSPYAPDNDLYLHLKRGEWMIKTLSLLKTDIFTYSQRSSPDEAVHSWLAQLVFYKLHQWGGELGLRSLNVASVYLTLLLLFSWLKKNTRSHALAFIGASLGLALHQRYQLLRPLIIGELFFAVSVFLLFDIERLKTRRGQLLLFLCGILWANCHASVVILPILFFSWSCGQILHHKKIKPLLGICVLLFLSTLLNPQGFGIYRYAIELSALGKQLGGSEWQVHWPIEILGTILAPSGLKFYYDINQVILCFSMFSLSLIILKLRINSYPDFFLALLCCFLAFVSNRHLSYLLFPLAFSLYFFFEKQQKSFNRFFIPSLVLTPLFLFWIGFHESYRVEPGISQATRFIKEIGFRGNVFNFHTWGSYLIYELYPNSRVASDARSLVHRDFLLKVNRLNPLPLNERRTQVLGLVPENTDLLFLSTNEESWQPLLERVGYIQIYENNVVTLALKSDLKHAPVLKQTELYYQKQGISFQSKMGITMEQTHIQNPIWTRLNTEAVNWGTWPVPLVQTRWAQSQAQFYISKSIAVPKEIIPFLNVGQENLYGGVRSFKLLFGEAPRKIYSALH